MKVVFTASDNQIINGICASLECCSALDTLVWNPEVKPVMDMFDEVKPSIVFIQGEVSPLELQIARSNYPQTQIVLVSDDDFDKFSPNLIITEKQIKEIPTIRPYVGANIAQINRGVVDDKLKSDIVCFSDNLNIDAKTGAVIDFICNSYKTKIFGSQKIQVPNYLGVVDNTTKSNAIKSAKVMIDLGQDSWKDACSIGTTPVVLSENTISGVNTFTDVSSLKKVLDKVFSEDKKGNFLKTMIYNKTYFDLASEVLSFFGLRQSIDELQGIKKELLS